MKIFKPTEHVLKQTKAEMEIVQGLNLNVIPKYYEINDDAIWTKTKGE